MEIAHKLYLHFFLPYLVSTVLNMYPYAFAFGCNSSLTNVPYAPNESRGQAVAVQLLDFLSLQL
jgi:hypothetical protein